MAFAAGSLVGTLVVAGEGQGGDEDVGEHEDDQYPGDDGALFQGDFFDPFARDRG